MASTEQIETVHDSTLYTRAQAATRLRVCVRTVDLLLAQKQLKSIAGGGQGGRRLITERQIREYIAGLERVGIRNMDMPSPRARATGSKRGAR